MLRSQYTYYVIILGEMGVQNWAKAGVPKKGWSPPKKGSVNPQMAVTNFKDLCEKDNSYFDSTTLFAKYLGLKMI